MTEMMKADNLNLVPALLHSNYNSEYNECSHCKGLADKLANTSHFEQENKWVYKFRDLPQKVSHWGSYYFHLLSQLNLRIFSFVKLSFLLANYFDIPITLTFKSVFLRDQKVLNIN